MYCRRDEFNPCRRMRPGLWYNGAMQLYRVLGYWYMEITADRQDGWRIADPSWPGPVPFVPLGINEEVFNKWIQYAIRVAYWSFGEMWGSLIPWSGWAQSEINGQVQYRPSYRWQPLELEAADGYFAMQGARKFVNPRFGPETLETVDPHTILAVYAERVWMYKQTGGFGRFDNWFEEVGPMGDILMFSSRDARWGKGHPDRMFTALRYFDLIEDTPRLIGRYWTKIAAIYLGKGYRIRDGVYRLAGPFMHRADMMAPTETWLGW